MKMVGHVEIPQNPYGDAEVRDNAPRAKKTNLSRFFVAAASVITAAAIYFLSQQVDFNHVKLLSARWKPTTILSSGQDVLELSCVNLGFFC